MRTRVLHPAAVFSLLTAFALPAMAQVDQQRAQEFFKEAQALCEKDAGRLWGVSICAPMVLGDARTQTFATSRQPPDAPRPKLIGILNGPIQWGDTVWAALSWETVADQPAHVRNSMLLHESFHIVQRQPLGLGVGTNSAEHLDTEEGRYWLRLEWHALARALRDSGESRTLAIRDAVAFRLARYARFPDNIETERALDINEGLASYTGIVLAEPSRADAIARALGELASQESGESYVRTAAYASGPAYGLLLDAASPGWTRTVRSSDNPALLLIHALGVQPTADAAAAAMRYGGPELRAAEKEREQQRQGRIAELRRRFVDGPILLMPGGGGGFSDSHGAVVIPDVGTIYFGEYHMKGAWGALDAEKGVLVSTDGRTRHLPAPVRSDGTTIFGDGWTLKLSPGWTIREGARRGDYELVQAPVNRAAAVLIPSVSTSAAQGATSTRDPRLSLDELPVITRVSLPSAADWIAFGFGSVWVVNYRPSRVSRIDTATNKVTADIPLGGNACLGIVVAEERVWVPTCSDGVVNEIDPAKDSVVRRLPAPIKGGREGAVAFADNAFWIPDNASDSSSSTLVRLDVRTGVVSPGVTAGVRTDVVVAGFGSLWASSSAENVVFRIDPTSGRVLARVAVGRSPKFIAAGEGAVWVQNRYDGSVSRIDPSVNREVARISAWAPTPAGDIAVGGGAVWLSVDGMPVIRIDPQRNVVTHEFVGGYGIDAIRWNAGSVWIADHRAGEVWRVDARRINSR